MTVDHSPATQARPALRQFLGNRTHLILIAIAVIGLGGYFNWGWLVAAGLAPVILGVLPCAAMCALGLCMGGMKNKDTVSATTPSPAAGSEVKADDSHGKDCC